MLSSDLPVERLVSAAATVEGPSEALELMLSLVMESTRAERGAVVLVEESGALSVTTLLGLWRDADDPASLRSHPAVQQALRAARPVYLREDGISPQLASHVGVERWSVLCLPVILARRALGVIYLASPEARSLIPLSRSDELAVLASLAAPFVLQLRQSPDLGPSALEGFAGESDAAIRVRRLIERIAPTDLSVLLQGATGTGKEVAARCIHRSSPRAHRAMITVNCSALPATLLEAELFGFRRGAFTGALMDRKGRIEAAHGSTLFLDEIGDMPRPMQAALLRVLENKEVVPLGDNSPREVDFRLITASHQDLATAVAEGRFREDLLFRLNEFTIELPPLSARGDDVLLLAWLFKRQFEQQLDLDTHQLSEAAEAALSSHPWPGNVRELRAVLRRAVVSCDDAWIEPAHLRLAPTPGMATSQRAPVRPLDTPAGRTDLERPLAEARAAFTGRYVRAVLAHFGGDKARAARSLGVSVRTLYRHLRGDAERAPGDTH